VTARKVARSEDERSPGSQAPERDCVQRCSPHTCGRSAKVGQAQVRLGVSKRCRCKRAPPVGRSAGGSSTPRPAPARPQSWAAGCARPARGRSRAARGHRSGRSGCPPHRSRRTCPRAPPPPGSTAGCAPIAPSGRPRAAGSPASRPAARSRSRSRPAHPPGAICELYVTASCTRASDRRVLCDVRDVVHLHCAHCRKLLQRKTPGSPRLLQARRGAPHAGGCPRTRPTSSWPCRLA